MSISIQNIKTSKEKYIFGEDKYVEVSFEILAIGESYSSVKLSAVHETQILEKEEVVVKRSKDIDLKPLENLIPGLPVPITFQVPIEFPNLDTTFFVKNYIKIKCTNFFGISYFSEDLLPSIINLDNRLSIDPIFTDLESFILSKRRISDPENYHKVQQKLEKLKIQENTPTLQQEILQLVDEQGEYYSLSEEDKLLIEEKSNGYLQQEIRKSQSILNNSNDNFATRLYKQPTLKQSIIACTIIMFNILLYSISIYIAFVGLGISLFGLFGYMHYAQMQRINIRFQSKESILDIINQGTEIIRLSDIIRTIQVPKRFSNDSYSYDISIYLSTFISEKYRYSKFSSLEKIGEITEVQIANYSGINPEIANFQIDQGAWNIFLKKRIPITIFGTGYSFSMRYTAESMYGIRIHNESDPTQEDIIYRIGKY